MTIPDLKNWIGRTETIDDIASACAPPSTSTRSRRTASGPPTADRSGFWGRDREGWLTMDATATLA